MKKTILKVMSVSIILAVCLSMTACGKKVEQTTATTTENTIVDESEVAISESAESESSETETEVATESSNSAMTDGQYTYVVDGIEVHLRTNIDDYIQPDQWGGYGVDLEGIANAWGFYYPYSSSNPVSERGAWSYDENGNSANISLNNEENQGFHRISFTVNGGHCYIDFSRDDLCDESVTSYWISYEDDALNKVNYEQIVIFTFLVENAAIDPDSEWVDELGLSETNPGVYFINR